MYFVYILQSLKDSGYYIGVTSNIERRFREHNLGLAKSTKSRRPFKMARIEQYFYIKDAYRREKFLKSKKSSKIISKIVASPDVPTKGRKSGSRHSSLS